MIGDALTSIGGLAALLAGGLILTALVSALESALFLLPEEGQRALRKRHPARGRQVDLLLDERRETTHALLFLDALLNLWVFFLLFLLVREWSAWGPLWQWLTGVTLFLICAALGEILPKSFARLSPLPTLEYTAGLGLFLVRLLRPLTRWWLQFESRVAPNYSESSDQLRAPELSDLLALIDLAREQHSLTQAEAELLREVLALGKERAAHVMTPRVDCFLLPDDLTSEEAATLLRTRRYHRVPVFGATPDDILGVLDVPRFLRSLNSPNAQTYLEQLDPPAFIPTSMPALDLLQSFLLKRRKMALLLDEYGGFEGLVTLSDLMEELLGQERPNSSSGLYLEKIRADEYLVSGQVRMDDLRRVLGWTPQPNEPDTFAGYLLSLHGSIPQSGTTIILPGWQATVRRSSRRRIKEVLLQRAGGDNS